MRHRSADFVGPPYLRMDASTASRLKQPHVRQSGLTKDRAVGLTFWGAVYVAPQQNISLQLLQAAGGLLYHGIIPGRDHDVAAVSVIAGVFSNRAPAHGTETVIEANYRIQLTPWLYLTPDFQYVVHPNGSTSIPDAAVLAGELSINF